MIFVTVGSSDFQFERLVAAVDLIGGDELVVAQYGSSRLRPAAAVAEPFLPFPVFERCVREARVVVAHGGIGAVGMCLRLGKRPVVVPRLRSYGECVDDHQVAFARRLAERGLAVAVEDVRELPAAVTALADTTLPDAHPATGLADELVRYLEGALDAADGGAGGRVRT